MPPLKRVESTPRENEEGKIGRMKHSTGVCFKLNYAVKFSHVITLFCVLETMFISFVLLILLVMVFRKTRKRVPPDA